MTAPNTIKQGETFAYEYELSGDDTDSFTYNMTVLQYPGDTPTIDRVLTVASGVIDATLTSAETTALAIGQWFIHIRASDSDEDVRTPKKLYISKGWL